MKKIVIIFCCISLFIFSGCVNLQKSTTNGEVSFNDSFTEELTFPFNADYQQIDFFSPDKWDLWSRTENKLFHDFSSEDEIFFWRVLLGRLTYKNSYSIDRIIADKTNHFDILQNAENSYFHLEFASEKSFI